MKTTEDKKKKGGLKDGLIQRGSTWSYVVRVRDPKTGKTKNIWKGGFPTQKAAKMARDNARAEANKGTAASSSRITVADYLKQWLDGHSTQIKATTHLSYQMHIDRYLVPHIGAYRLQQLTPLMIGKLYADLQREGGIDRHKVKEGQKPKSKPLSANTVRRVRATLHKALADAVTQRLIPYNPSDQVKPPRVDRDTKRAKEMKTWTRTELDAFLASATSDRLFPMWRLAAMTGMRRGEVCGLAWRDLDLESGTIMVQRSRVTVKGSDVRESTPKSADGRRLVELDQETVLVLKAWKTQQERERTTWNKEALDKDRWPGHDLVFTYQDGKPYHPDALTRAFHSQVKRTTLPTIRLHDLRHTHATILLAAGTPIKVVSERLGHSTPEFTMKVYQHVLPGMQREWVQRMADQKTAAVRHLKVVANG